MIFPTLFDLAVLQRNDQDTGMIDDVTTLPREWDVIAAHPREGTWYKIVKLVGLPSGGFRSPNQGVTSSKAIWTNAIKEMLFLDMQMIVDEAIWDGDDASAGSIWSLEAAATMRAAAIVIGQQFYYGTSGDPKGFAGIRSQLAYSVSAGTTGTANSTSAYMVWGDEREGVRFDVGKNGSFALSPPFRQWVTDPNDSTKGFFAYVGNLKAYIGLFVGSNLSAWSISGIPGDATNVPITPLDTYAQQLYAHIPQKRRNNLRWFMNRTSEAILQQKRSAVFNTSSTILGSAVPADAAGRPMFSPLPNMLNGWPIEITDSILNTETN